MPEKMIAWLQTFPGWTDAVQIDFVDAMPGNAGFYPKGLTELSRREDVQGNLQVRCRYDFTIRRNASANAGNARWLLELQNWVMDQQRLGLAPKFGDDPKTECIRAAGGQLQRHEQVGSALYTLQIQAEFTKIYRGE